MKIKNAFALLLVLFLFGCATPVTVEIEEPQGDYVFVMADETRVFSVVYHALAKEVEPELIREINGPVKGFRATHEKWGKGKSVFNVRVLAANGVDAAGHGVYGYFAEVLVEGNKETEAESARNIFWNIENVLGQEGQKVYVSDMQRAKYRNDSLGNYKSGGGFNFGARPAPVFAPAETIRPEAPLAEPAVNGRPMPRQSAPAVRQPEAAPRVQEPAPVQAAPRSAQPAQRISRSMADEIEKLSDLHKKGILSDEEFQRAKERVLNW